MDQNIVRSGMIGLVVGDALGVPVEFESRLALAKNPVTGMRSGGTYGLPAGTWSDDSSMALCLMESLTHGLDYQSQMEYYLKWANDAYMTPYDEVFDMGVATKTALRRYLSGTPALECGCSNVNENGNGSLMRILPLAMYLHSSLGADFPTKDEAYEIIEKASGLTHAHPISMLGCALYCAIANEFLCGRSSDIAIQSAINQVKAHYHATDLTTWVHVYKRIDVKALKELFNDEIQSSGYVVSTLEAALWCLLTTDNYRDCVLKAVNLGEDTDTVAAVAGGLAGLKYGMAGIPEEWTACIARYEMIGTLCDAFAQSLNN